MYLPKETPFFSGEQIGTLLQMRFHACISLVLNALFDTKLTAAEIELCVGKRPVYLKDIGQRVFILECWHSPEQSEIGLTGTLSRLLRGKGSENVPGDWPAVAIRASLLIASMGVLHRAGMLRPGQGLDFAVMSGDFSAVMSGWYVKEWGFPINRIICTCNENCGIWDLLHQGELRTDAISIHTMTPASDVPVPPGVERLVYSCGGFEECNRFRDCFQYGKAYMPKTDVLEKMRQALAVSVIRMQRAVATKEGVKRSSGYEMSMYDAVCYTGIQDFRAGGGGSRPCILLSQYAPQDKPGRASTA